jgi:solute:Na+ symporter, SSS family
MNMKMDSILELSPYLILGCIGLYFLFLLGIAWYSGRNANNDSYFLGNKASPWYAVAFGMIGDSLSGVTFISVPGAVGDAKFSYLQLVIGYLFGYIIITQILLPLYYKMQLTSIYTYLRTRFGSNAERTGSFFFILSRTLGAAARLYLAAGVLQMFVFQRLGVPFVVTVSVIIFLMLVYTYKGGIKTLVWTDMFQSCFLLLGVVLSIFAICNKMDLGFTEMIDKVASSEYVKTFNWDWQSKGFFFKQFLGGMFIAIAMTGLDQNMMQKNLSCRSLEDAQKNIRWFSVVLVLVNLLFLCLGALLWIYAIETSNSFVGDIINKKAVSDHLFPHLALNELGVFAGLVFIVGLTAATFSSADSVLTTLTTSFYVDFLRANERKVSKTHEEGGPLDKPDVNDESGNLRIRHITHAAFAVILLVVILLFDKLNSKAIIDTVLMIAGYTYGPLLGMFAFGILTKRRVMDSFVPALAILSPVICYVLSYFSKDLFGGYVFGNELLLLNGSIMFFGMFMLSSPSSASSIPSNK